jgi:sulfur transfer protein SufE
VVFLNDEVPQSFLVMVTGEALYNRVLNTVKAYPEVKATDKANEFKIKGVKVGVWIDGEMSLFND